MVARRVICLLIVLTTVVSFCGCSMIFEPDLTGKGKQEKDAQEREETAEITEALSKDAIFTSAVAREENPASFHTAGTTQPFGGISADHPFYSLLERYPQENVRVTVHAEIKQHGKWEADTTIQVLMGPETVAERDFSSNKTSYTPVSLSYVIKAQRLTKQKLSVRFVWHDGSIDSYGLLQNVYYTVEFVEDEELVSDSETEWESQTELESESRNDLFRS